MSAAGGSVGAPTGCYKCERPGHWSRDCPSNPSTAAGGAPGGGESGGKSQSTGRAWGSAERDVGGGGWKDTQAQTNTFGLQKSAVKEAVRKEPKKRPKLTADLILSEGGLGYVLEKMPEIVSMKGREDTVVEDLRSLLEGYMHWHTLILPYFSFDQFVEKVEKVGASKRVRECARELREKIEYGKEVEGDVEAKSQAHDESSLRVTPREEPSVHPEREADDGTYPQDVFPVEEPEMPVNNEDFEDFYRQGVEDNDTRPTSTAECSVAPEIHVGSSVVCQSNPVATEDDIAPSIETQTIITESVRALMESNRLRALERARARRAGNEACSPSGLPSEDHLADKGTSLAGNGDSTPRVVAGSTLSDSARALMETNRSKALERARARRAGNMPPSTLCSCLLFTQAETSFYDSNGHAVHNLGSE